MSHIIPTVFAHNTKEFKERFRKLLPVANCLQIDFMDGKFVPSKSMPLSVVPSLKKYKKKFEAHLMVFHPEKWITKLKQKGFNKIIFHIEATKKPLELIDKIKKLKMKPMVAINPNTDIKIIPKGVDVLFMGVHPGREHQSFKTKVYSNIKKLRKQNKKINIQVDGGVSHKNITRLVKSGANLINSGSYIGKSDNPKAQYKKLYDLYRKAK